MTMAFFLSPMKVFWYSFAYFIICAIIIIYGLGPALQLSDSMGGPQHDGYLEIASNVVGGNGYVFEANGEAVIHRPPLYVFLLTPTIFLPEFLQRIGVIFLNSVLAAATAMVLRQMALRFTRNDKVAMGAVVLFVTNPWVVWSLKNPYSVVLQMFLYLLLAFVVILAIKRKKAENRKRLLTLFVWLGIICGFASLSHGIMLPVSCVVLTVLAMLAFKRKEVFKLPAVLISFLVMAIVVLPWTIRNYEVTGRFIPVAGNSGVAYFIGNAYWGITKPPVQKGESLQKATLRHAGVSLPVSKALHYWGTKEPSVAQQIDSAMVRHFSSHPLHFSKKVYLNAIGYYFPIAHSLIVSPTSKTDEQSAERNLISGAMFEDWLISCYYGIFIIIGALSVVFAKNSFLGVGGVCTMIFFGLLYALPYFPFLTHVGHNHYVFGTLPFIYVLAANSLICVYYKLHGRRIE